MVPWMVASCASAPAGSGEAQACVSACAVDWALWPMPNGSDDVSAGAPNLNTYSDNMDGTVSDAVTRLMWQQQVPVTGGPSEDGNLTWTAANDYCATLSASGHADWRLPSEIELVSLLDYSNLGQGHPSIDSTVFPDTSLAAFWSSTPLAGADTNQWTVYFDAGFTYAYDVSTVARVRCVRLNPARAASADGAGAPLGRYTAQGPVVIDNLTHLTWQAVVATSGGQDGAGRSTWADAKSTCATLGGGYRLPTAKELLTLIDFSRTSPAIDTSLGAFPDTPPEPFWTATPLQGIDGDQRMVHRLRHRVRGQCRHDASEARAVRPLTMDRFSSPTEPVEYARDSLFDRVRLASLCPECHIGQRRRRVYAIHRRADWRHRRYRRDC